MGGLIFTDYETPKMLRANNYFVTQESHF